MTEQDYRTADAPSLPVHPTHLPATPSIPTVAPAATLPTQPVPAAPVTTEPQVAVAAPEAVAPVAEPVAQPVTEAAVEVADESGAEANADPVANSQPTRPAVASRRARRPAGGARKVTRYTLDLEAEMHKGLRLFAVSQDVDASKVMRALLWLLMANQELPAGVTLADLVLDEIFGAEDE